MVEDLNDRDQEEALRTWWRENWKFILAGVVIGLVGLAGWTYFKKYLDSQAEHAATVYADFQKALASNDDTQAGKLLDSLAGEHANSAYTQEGRLLLIAPQRLFAFERPRVQGPRRPAATCRSSGRRKDAGEQQNRRTKSELHGYLSCASTSSK